MPETDSDTGNSFCKLERSSCDCASCYTFHRNLTFTKECFKFGKDAAFHSCTTADTYMQVAAKLSETDSENSKYILQVGKKWT